MTGKYVYFDIRMKFTAAEAKETDLPIIVIGNPETTPEAFEIGNSTHLKKRMIGLSIYARDEIELGDIVSAISSRFDGKNISMINYRVGEPLDDNGFLNANYTAPLLNAWLSLEYQKSVPIYSTLPNKIDKYCTVIDLNLLSLV